MDSDPPQYTTFQIRVPLVALSLAALIILVGFALLVTGQVLFQSNYSSATQFTLATNTSRRGRHSKPLPRRAAIRQRCCLRRHRSAPHPAVAAPGSSEGRAHGS
ncbi:hypothetical protein CLOP_g18780 [Closterium sp. NIES-67]|nr:hypothetical protein CLOP_g18780 [Closterium sp. NIES-67]